VAKIMTVAVTTVDSFNSLRMAIGVIDGLVLRRARRLADAGLPRAAA